MLQILDPYTGLFEHEIPQKKLQHDFLKMRGGGQRPLGTFPKIYPFWYRHPSLRSKTKYEKVQLHKELSGPAIIWTVTQLQHQHHPIIFILILPLLVVLIIIIIFQSRQQSSQRWPKHQLSCLATSHPPCRETKWGKILKIVILLKILNTASIFRYCVPNNYCTDNRKLVLCSLVVSYIRAGVKNKKFQVRLVLWFLASSAAPLYTYDTRGKSYLEVIRCWPWGSWWSYGSILIW